MRHDILLKIRLLSGANLYGKFASCMGPHVHGGEINSDIL